MDARLQTFPQVRILVVGDLILDRYWHGSSTRVSPEAPVPVVDVERVEERAGGAANVALNARALDCDVTLVGVVGNDTDGEVLAGICQSAGLRTSFLVSSHGRTTVKLRVVSQNQQLLRADFEASGSCDDAGALIEIVCGHMDSCDVVVVSDYAKGALYEVESIIELARSRRIPVVIDPKGTDFERYRGATVVTPNRKELESVVGPCKTREALSTAAFALAESLDLESLLVTQSAEGMSLFLRDGSLVHVGAKARDVFDVTGAGDTVCATLGASLAAVSGWRDRIELANTAAGVVVGKFGAATVTRTELEAALRHELSQEVGAIVPPGELADMCRQARSRGERLVFTNGCFDIIHHGHVEYLQAAAALGDRLIVAVNDDDSVRRLKGEQRPINDLSARMGVLRAIAGVDWVTSFSEATPLALIEKLEPDVLAKGGDYAADDVVGGDFVRSRGGEVAIIDFREGHSTTDLIERIRSTPGDLS